ncbi:NADP-dependent 3-hydroxy acid dehydrogenase YdfG [Jatrophihabitans endophyticus]|uniref:NADP-dependent 3-hydroxy acid dehydrogenase YdfG n=1 Tax=Jatrophihabitans endophyticus TaxID=1206085 RepID=A0A1M5CUA5_9ACTN|nr:oxidoreductase [Jatrophihabitans endophyticus]SHF58331.1 NADP-dependent 3-hydroxy acid dehydrogenase YdfG [Jatrophihabitans endophyticus]
MTTNESNDRVWLVTGCSSGLGRALADEALRRGDRVVVTARRSETVGDLAAAHPGRALPLALDVTDDASVRDAVAAAEAHFGRIDVVVNNAGYGYLAAVEEGEDEPVATLFDTNVHGVVRVLKAVLPGMRRRRSGRVVNVSSFGGLAAFAATGYYHATKFALEGLSESLAAELAPLGIAVTIVEPGGMRTDWAGASMQQSPVRIADYDETAGARRTSTLAVSGRQPGDPRRAAAAIVAAVERDEPPLRLLLGSDALAGATARWERLRREADADAPLTRSADLAAS